MITHDLQALLEDLLCTNHYETSHLASLHLTSRKQNRQHVVAVLFPTTRFMKKYLCLLLTYLFVLLKCVFRRKKALKQISNAFHSSAVSNDALYEEVLVLVTYLLICFTWARAQKKESSIASSFQLVLISLFEQRDIYKYKESIIIKSTLANRII